MEIKETNFGRPINLSYDLNIESVQVISVTDV